MKRDLAIVILITYLVITGGCKAVLIGMGAAAGTGAVYIAGKDTGWLFVRRVPVIFPNL